MKRRRRSGDRDRDRDKQKRKETETDGGRHSVQHYATQPTCLSNVLVVSLYSFPEIYMCRLHEQLSS